MLTWIRRILAPPIFEGDPDRTRRARLLNTILWAYQAIWFLGLLAMPLAENPQATIPVMVAMLVLGFVALALMRAGRLQVAGRLFLFNLWLAAAGLISVSGGLESPMIFGFVALVLIAALLLGERAVIASAGLAIVAAAGITVARANGYLPPPLISDQPIPSFATFVGNMIAVTALLYITIRSLTEALDQSRRYAGELAEQREHLEETVAQRTQDLTRRTRYLEATAAIARDAASVLDLREQLTRVVNLVSRQFGFYHTGIFLLDPSGEWAVLQAASSEGGRSMLARGHRLRLGVGIVGYAVERGQPRIALDVGQDAVFFDNPDLPDTRSEMALPLRARGRIIGALDVQSREPEAFGDEDVAVLQTLADQVAVAISNARLFEQAQEALAAERRAYGEMSSAAWRELLRAEPDLGYLSQRQDTVPAGDLWRAEMKAAVEQGETALGDEDSRTVAIPIKISDQVVGVVDGRKADGSGGWSAEEIELLEALTEQLNVALEGSRLYQDVQRRAAREQLISQVSARMRETLDLDTVLHSALQEMRETLGFAEVAVLLDPAGDWSDEA
ncbi:MAG: GAF domain-containing protein [Anaerolineae bacterium]